MRSDRRLSVWWPLAALTALAVLTALPGQLSSAQERPPAGAQQPAPHDVMLGVDLAGSALPSMVGTGWWEHAPFLRALADLGVQLVNLHVTPIVVPGKDSAPQMQAWIESIDRALRARGLRYTLDLESPNFRSSAEITPGINEFEQPGGLHFWPLRMAWLDGPVSASADGCGFQALVYDEAAHMQLSNNKYSNYPHDDFDQPFLVNTHGMPLEEAHEALVARCRDIRQGHYQGKVRLNTEQVWPDLFHIFRRAGWTANPKLLKEHFSSVVMAVALGAAIQYRDADSQLWVSPDLWWVGQYPGHSHAALRSALLMGYWLGADAIYVENLDYAGTAERHPQAAPQGSLLAWRDPDHYELTPHGRVVQEFYREYVPAHRRTIDWRNYRPRVAIIRLPDGGWGQFSVGDQPWPHGEAASRNRLLGNRDMPLDAPASEWLQIWSLLTHGVTRPGAITYNNPMVYPEQLDFFVPLDSVAVFDHLVSGPVLDSVECFVVCGHALSRPTYEALRRRAEQGATCLIARRLHERFAAADKSLPDNWVVIDDFAAPRVAELLRPFLGPPDVARFRFENATVTFRKGPQPDSLTVDVRR